MAYIDDNIDVKDLSQLACRELKASPATFQFDLSVFAVDENGGAHEVTPDDVANRAKFFQNLKYWNNGTGLMSTNNLDNSYFKEIVNMGTDAVPFIVGELKKGPTPLVHALDLMFPGVVEYKGFVSLKEACEKWLSILS